MDKVIVGIGELLWDMLPSGARLGGAPANFAYIASLLGGSAAVASCVGDDGKGYRARRMLNDRGLDVQNVQVDPHHPTGTVTVELSENGTPTYTITENVAWDHVGWSPELKQLAANTSAVCFGTLAQRNSVTRETIREFLLNVPSECLIVFDVNCRAPFYRWEMIKQSLVWANVLKVSAEELGVVLEAASMTATDEIDAARQLQERFEFKAVAITRGENGSVIAMDGVTDAHPGVDVQVVDTVGAGDAFAAALAMSLLKGVDINTMNEAANQVAAWVASCEGAMPEVTQEGREGLISLLNG